MGAKLKEEKELTLYPNKNATVAELLEEAKKDVELSLDIGSGRLRYFQFICILYFLILIMYVIFVCTVEHQLLESC